PAVFVDEQRSTSRPTWECAAESPLCSDRTNRRLVAYCCGPTRRDGYLRLDRMPEFVARLRRSGTLHVVLPSKFR
ncbi:hypothetical protein, partial [Rhodopirellula sp. UBA1907]